MRSLLAKLFPCFFSGEQHICDRLPEELWTDIFGRLPSNSLFNCLLVCKSWRRFITGPSFVSAHLAKTLGTSTAGDNHVDNNRRQSLLFCYSEGQNWKKFSLRFDDNSFALHSDALVPPVAASSTLAVVGSCNGLVCLSDRSNLVLWNPHISKSLTLPPPGKRDVKVDVKVDPSLELLAIGFGIGSGADDFKVLILTAASSSSEGGNVIPLVSDLYSVRTGSWKSIPIGAPNYELISNNLAFASGRLHGIVQTQGNSRNWVLVFDLRTETFGEIMLPKCLTKVPAWELSVKAFGDSSTSTIAVVRSVWRVFPMETAGRMTKNFEIWVMSKYGEAESWDKAYDGIPSPGISMTSLLAFRRNEEAFVAASSERLYTLKLKGRTRNSGESLNGGWVTMTTSIDPYVKSLALLDKGEGIDLNRYPITPSWISSVASWCLDALRALPDLPMNLMRALGDCLQGLCLCILSDPDCLSACIGACLQACCEILLTAIFEACCGTLHR